MLPFKRCRCQAQLKQCNHNNPLCPASTVRLLTDYEQAIKELFEFTEQDKQEKNK